MTPFPPSATTRFAPSPTGLLHLGHAFAALFAARAGSRFLLRIEDIDATRCRAEFEAGILEDLGWLGLRWESPVRRQSEHFADYRAALERLTADGFVYPCFCTRREIEAEVARIGRAPHGPAGPIYPGTCRRLPADERAALLASGRDHALRLDVAMALAATGPLDWRDVERGTIRVDPSRLGDIVLARKDIATSYHLAVTLDDALQGVTLVTRGEDLFESTHSHRLLQAMLGLDVPDWHHHRLIADADGQRLAKRDRAVTLRALREAGRSAMSIRRDLGFDSRGS